MVNGDLPVLVHADGAEKLLINGDFKTLTKEFKKLIKKGICK